MSTEMVKRLDRADGKECDRIPLNHAAQRIAEFLDAPDVEAIKRDLRSGRRFATFGFLYEFASEQRA